MRTNEVFIKYESLKAHVETHILPRNKEWAIKERYEKKLPTHNQNCLKAYNITELVDIYALMTVISILEGALT